MTQRGKLKYEDFWDSINVDAFEEAINWAPEYTHNDNDVGFCVFPDNHSHGDTTGKFAIHREKRVYNCWACKGGSLLSLAMELRDLDVDEATEWLYEFTEEDLRSDSEFVDEFLDSFRDSERRIQTLPYFNERVLNRFDEPLEDAMEWDSDRDEYVPFLTKRGFDPEIVNELFRLRYSSSIRRPGPVRGRYADEPDYVGPGVVFPHYWQERLVGWQVRWLDEDRPEWVPKYTNTSDFPKETTIYGRDQAGSAKRVIVVESVPSVIFLRSHGYPAVATFGSNVNPAQQRLLRRYPEIILASDNDKAGQKWLEQNTTYLKRYSRVWHLPMLLDDEGYDIGDLAKEPDVDTLLPYYIDKLIWEPGIEDPSVT